MTSSFALPEAAPSPARQDVISPGRESEKPPVPVNHTNRANVQALTVGVWIVAALAVIFALRIGRPLFVPLIVGLILSYVLDPVVNRLVKRGVPRALGATLVLVSTLLAVAATGYAVRNQAMVLIARLPGAAQEIRKTIEREAGPAPGPLAQVQQAADELKRVSSPPPRRQGQTVQVESGAFDVSAYLWESSGAAVNFASAATVVMFLAFYLLLSGDLFRRLLIEIAGPTLSRKKITLKILDDISAQISAYLFVRVLISAIVAVGTGLGLWATGLAQPAVWGLVAGILNVVPYVGPLVVAVAVGIAAFLQFHTLAMVALIVGTTVGIAIIEAYLITPWLTSRAAEMNPAAVFVGLAFWGWLWGLPGLLLAMPLLMIFKAVGDHIEAVRPIVTLLRDDAPRGANGAAR